MKYCIIDDEPIAHRIIEGYCKDISFLEKAGNCYDVFDAMQLLNTHKIDLIFLDINMPKLSGFELLKTLSQQPKVIVTSAYQEFALEGYELNVSDYLLKPFSFERFLKAIHKVSTQTPLISRENTHEKSTRLFLKGDKKIFQMQLSSILFIEAYGNYIKVYTTSEMMLCHEKISALESKLPIADFLRVHKSFLVAIDKIQQIEGNRITINGHHIPVGQTYKQQLKRLF